MFLFSSRLPLYIWRELILHAHRKLPAVKLRALLDEMHTWFHNMLGQFRREQEEIRTKIVEAIVALKSESSETSQSGHVVQIAGEVGEWLTVYFQCVVYFLI